MNEGWESRVVAMHGGLIQQADLDECVALRNEIRSASQQLKHKASRIFSLMQSGAKVESGSHAAEILETNRGPRLIRELLIDGTPVMTDGDSAN